METSNMEWAAIITFIFGVLRIFRPHLLILVVNWCNKIEEVRIKTKTGETIISKIKFNQHEINHQDLPVEQKLISS